MSSPENRKYSKQESHSSWAAWLLKTAIIVCPETSETIIQRRVTYQKIENFIYTYLSRGGSLKSCGEFYYETLQHFSGQPEKFGESPYIACILTPLTRVIQKLTRLHLVPKAPAFYGTRNFITAFQRTSHLSLLVPNNFKIINYKRRDRKVRRHIKLCILLWEEEIRISLWFCQEQRMKQVFKKISFYLTFIAPPNVVITEE